MNSDLKKSIKNPENYNNNNSLYKGNNFNS